MKRKRTLASSLLFTLLLLVTSVAPVAADDQPRFGFGANSHANGYNWSVLGAGWFHAWRMRIPYHLDGLDFYPMVGAYGDLMGDETEATIRDAIDDWPQNYPPGTVWIISNELEYDIFTTKNGVPLNPPRAITPSEYADKYKKYRDILKGIDSTYQTAIGFINSIPEDGRPYTLADYVNAIKTKYGGQIPVDVYNLHVYGFGRSIDFEICFQGTVNHYRQTMADLGVRDKPLIITELGVLEGVYVSDIPTSYVLDFQERAFDWLRVATSSSTGMPADGNRLVQRWAWFALTGWHPADDHKWDQTALFDIDTGAITPVGQAYADYIANLSNQTVDIPLRQGWNLISIPVELDNYAVQDVLAPISGKYDLVYAWDASSDQWKTYQVGAPPGANTLTTLSKEQGFWVRATQNTTLIQSGAEQSVVQIPLLSGWNLIAYPLLDAQPVQDALSSVQGKYTSVHEYDAANPSNPWLKYSPGAPAFVSDLSQMKPGKGYWINATQNCTLTFTEPL